MRNYWILFVMGLVAGCATQRPAARVAPPLSAPKPVVRESSTTRTVETRYDIRSYRDADSPSVRHDAHAVYRATRVPARVESLDTVPRTEFAPVSYTPLSPSAELSAELTAQREITAELRAVHARMAAVEQQAKSQYGTLVDQTAETVKLRRQLEEERARLQELEAKVRDRPASSPVAVLPTGAPIAAETKW